MEIKKRLLRDITLMATISGFLTPLALKAINPTLKLGYLEFTISLLSNFILTIFMYFVLVEGNLKDYFNYLTNLLSRLRKAKKAGKVEDMKVLLENVEIEPKGKDFISEFSKELLYFLNAIYQDELLDHYQNEINDIFGKTLEGKVLASKVYQFLYDKFGVLSAVFFSQKGGEIELVHAVNMDPIIPEGLAEIIESNKVKVLNVDDVAVKFPGNMFLKSVCIIPLVTETWKGAVIVGKTEKMKGLEILFYRRIRHSMAQAFRNAYAYELLKKESTIDPLTRLFNRRFGLKRLRELVKLALRENKPIAIGMLDIDNFKRINDTYGHLAGDYVLKKIAEIIKENIRETDLAVRFGGEEILLVLYGTDEHSAKEVFERIRRLVENSSFTYEGQDIPVTVSIG
ncbi:MAG: GGDEF domain-containing protein, partial [Desulfurobacteriaceae bacterium]